MKIHIIIALTANNSNIVVIDVNVKSLIKVAQINALPSQLANFNILNICQTANPRLARDVLRCGPFMENKCIGSPPAVDGIVVGITRIFIDNKKVVSRASINLILPLSGMDIV
ncbi:hypothetical protein SAMN06295888_104206 [Desulfonatronum zhilinae]|nr:hypothetical protein SAMN06295888_104206 [Desulfonatronum zhilinae]